MPKIWCDGGCRGNGTAHAQTYGSFLVDGENVRHRVELAGKTNNEAEYMTLIRALEYARAHQIVTPWVIMDSALVVEQTNGRWKCHAPTLRPLVAAAQRLLKETQATLTWTDRDEIVAVLGH